MTTQTIEKAIVVHPSDSIEAALAQIPNGGTLLMEGDFEDVNNRLRLNNRCYTAQNPLIIDGQNMTVHVPKVDVQDSQHITLKNMEIRGGVGLNNSLKSYENCLAHITFENILSRFGQWFAGGYTYHDITLKDCTIQENIYKGSCTHQIYFSGGHWEGSIGLPHPHDINIIGCTIRWCGGRHGIQVNGCFDDVNIIGNTIYCHAFTGFQGIGIERCRVEGNTIFACNRGALNLYDYWDNFYWPAASPEYVEYWKQCHHPNRWWLVRKNTLVVGPKSWGNWYDGSKPDKRPAILINNEVDGMKMPYGEVMDYPAGPHFIHDNLIVSLWDNVIEFHELSSAGATEVKGNYMVGHEGRVNFNSDVPIEPKSFTFDEAAKLAPELYKGNVISADDIKQWPEYPDATSIPPSPDYEWDKHPISWDLFSATAAARGKGAKYCPFIWTPGKAIKANALATKTRRMEEIGGEIAPVE